MKTAKCPLCSEIFNEPKTLPCLHSFCLACLDKLARTERRGLHLEISCPMCQTSFPIPEGDTFSDLPTSFHLDRFSDILAMANGNQGGLKCSNCKDRKAAISYCYVCQDYLCFACDRAHRRLRATRNHRNILLENVQTLLNRPAMCPQEYHEKEPLNLYCQQCFECVCQVCHVQGHWRHDVINIEQAAKQGETQLIEAVENAEKEITASENQLKENTDILEHRKEQIEAARKTVKKIVNLSIQSLNKHKKAVLTKLDDIYEELQNSHETKQRELKLFVTRLRSPVEQGKCVMQRNFGVEIVEECQAVVNRCEDLLNSKANWESFQLPFVTYTVDKEMFKNVRVSGPGRVIVSNTDPSQSVARGAGLRDPLIHKENSFTILTRDSSGNKCYHKGDQMKVKIENPLGEEMEITFNDEKNGKYQVSFTPELVGEHEAMISINGQPLTNSPWSVQVTAAHQYQRVCELGSKGVGDGQFWYPCGIAICETSGDIAVTEYFRKKVQIFSSSGRYLRQFGDTRNLSKNLKRPSSVAFSAEGDIIVIDSDKMVFCLSSGVFLWYVGNDLVEEPQSVSVTSDGKIIVCDKKDAKVKVLDRYGHKLVQTFPRDPFFYGKPSYAVHHEEKFFVSYPKRHRVKVFDGDGNFLYNIGGTGCDEERLRSPLGLAIDNFSNLVVCDSVRSRLQVFKLDGRHVATVEGESSQLGSPQFVAASKDGHLFVTDRGKKCVHVFY